MELVLGACFALGGSLLGGRETTGSRGWRGSREAERGSLVPDSLDSIILNGNGKKQGERALVGEKGEFGDPALPIQVSSFLEVWGIQPRGKGVC